ncbi:MAG: 2-amino-4-hydroxy-6-hydroxymethyldihydropteridine diphosphokinase [Prevotella sp.]|nr:2-amino-4-hydroxy-6-hydroxymethyldihydropteridine diphosphokinase [Prevotella sp.]
MHEVFLGLGSNIGERETLLNQACKEIERLIGPIVVRSAFIETEPWGYESTNKFLNAVVRCHTNLEPLPLLNVTQSIERRLGKRKKHATERLPQPSTIHHPPSTLHPQPSTIFHDRPIDIDILLYDCATINEPRLQVPHPLMLQRDFVMIPLREVLNQEDDNKYLNFLLGQMK